MVVFIGELPVAIHVNVFHMSNVGAVSESRKRHVKRIHICVWNPAVARRSAFQAQAFCSRLCA
ncbi:hypothetical protein MASR1M32_20810 [Rhodobacter sp.]